MAVLREIKRIEDLFEKEILNFKEKLKLNKTYKTREFDTRIFENNFYTKTLKRNKPDEKFIEIKEDTELEILGKGILNILIKKDSFLELNFSQKFLGIIRVIIEKNIKCKILDTSSNKEIFKLIQIYQKENSNLDYGFINKESRFSFIKSYLEYNSQFELKGAYYSNSIENFISSQVNHIGESSNSEIIVNGVAVNGARVLCDGLVRIEKNAINSSGHQKLNGLLLDDESSILSEPVLEIENKDVKCSHGASISQIKDEIIFYMNSRGIKKEDAIDLIVNSYIEQVKMFLNLKQELISN